MNHRSLSILLCMAPSAIGAAYAGDAADTFPSRPIRFVVPYPTGGAPDLMARTIGAHLTERWGQQVLVDNRPGANGTIASEITSRATPDGQTIQMGSVATHAINSHLYRKLPYDPLKEFSYITQVGYAPLILTAHPSVPATNPKTLVALAKAKPAYYTFASSGSGSVGHLSGEMLAMAGGVKLVHVPYKGIANATTDLLSGQINMTVGNILNALPHLRSGRLKAIGVTGPQRSPLLPDVEAIAETFPGFEAILWWGVFGPAGIPKPIVGKLNAEMVKYLALPQTKERWAKGGAVITGTSSEELAAAVKRDHERWRSVVKASGAKAN